MSTTTHDVEVHVMSAMKDKAVKLTVRLSLEPHTYTYQHSAHISYFSGFNGATEHCRFGKIRDFNVSKRGWGMLDACSTNSFFVSRYKKRGESSPSVWIAAHTTGLSRRFA